MPDDAPRASKPAGFNTRLSHAGRAGTHAHGFVNPPLLRGSTVLSENSAARHARDKTRLEQTLTYGIKGSATHWALEDVIAEIEGGTRCQIVSSGLAAITVPLLAFLSAGEHVLIPDSVYGPGRRFADTFLTRMGIEASYYDPMIDGAGLKALMRPNTKVVYTESPGSHTFEVQDLPALAEVAHAHGAKVMIDNTWGIHFLQPFRHGADVSIQALTKYVCGHSDILLGSITTAHPEDWERVRNTTLALGQYASPDDCWLALRGVRTMGVRLARQMDSGLEVARWLAARPEVQRVLHPALESCPGHEFWKRDFTGACSLFAIVLRPEFSDVDADAFADSLQLFGIGASWGGYESLVLTSDAEIKRSAGTGRYGGPLMRLHIGLEDVPDLLADLDQGFSVMRQRAGAKG